MEILRQLGELFLEAAPTAVLVFFFYLFLRWSFFKPITRVMSERASRLEGAHREAERLRTEAEEKRRAHQDGLRKARAQIFSEQEVARRGALDERAGTIQQARAKGNEEVQAGRERITADLAAARVELETTAENLAEQIVQSVLEKPQFSTTPVSEAQ